MDFEPNRVRAVTVWLGVVLNLGGVIPLVGTIPNAYRPDSVPAWVEETIAAPTAAQASALMFTAGVVLLAAWGFDLARVLKYPLGVLLIAVGGILNAAATLTPVLVVHGMAPGAEQAVLSLSLALDALFNGCLGAGLLALGVLTQTLSRPVRAFLVVAGLLTMPVALQLVFPAAASWLGIAGPAWLIALAILGWQDFQGHLSPSVVATG